ncbi:hypothetical protein B0H17DRAFT_1148196 [Mycena rosella]|uniref:Uncharacterized protein n=1 Tax=Mycena rosella TaxID=1033263 RepID=A0AAD7CDC8_MYCRO|nr:hypothetical protein B0H17DRAFT_1148196 [Mycena rosella]
MEDDSENQYLENMTDFEDVPGNYQAEDEHTPSSDPVMPGGLYPTLEDYPVTKIDHIKTHQHGGALRLGNIDSDNLGCKSNRAWDSSVRRRSGCVDAIAYAVPFNMFFKLTDVPLFRALEISDVERKTLPATLEPGYTMPKLTWLGGPATRTHYLDAVAQMLQRGYAGAFLAQGGITCRIALWVDRHLLVRFAKGPSTRITEYGRGFVSRGVIEEPDGSLSEELLTREVVMPVAWLGLKARALAWLERAWAWYSSSQSPSPPPGLGLAWLWPEPGLEDFGRLNSVHLFKMSVG